jgi:hypothetical protein
VEFHQEQQVTSTYYNNERLWIYPGTIYLEDWSSGSAFRKLIIDNNNIAGTKPATLLGNPGENTFSFDKIVLKNNGHLEMVLLILYYIDSLHLYI